MLSLIGKIREVRLDALLDYFIPPEIQVNPGAHRRARMFMLSHAFGPILGNTIPIYLYVMGIAQDYRVAIFFASILSFWIYPPLLRWTGRYQLLAFVSVQNLIFCVFWACYSFGGMVSPFVPWILIFPLLAFLYLPTTGIIRNLLLAQIVGSFVTMVAIMMLTPLPPVDLEALQVIGMVSMISVAIYFAMMSLYFARMFHEQQTFARELNALVSTSDNVRNLTASANQASAAKADFVASMSHELRTPLNAIIGYSQLLVDEAIDENDEETLTDLQKVNSAGSQLLRLIDDILDFSRIEAGKMPIAPASGQPSSYVEPWMLSLKRRLAGTDFTISILGEEALRVPFCTDWNIFGQTLRQACAACASRSSAGSLELRFSRPKPECLSVDIVDVGSDGVWRTPVPPNEEFENTDDTSASKYGAVGIEMALAIKFARLIGGEFCTFAYGENQVANRVTFPRLNVNSVAEAA
jgi:signal transduction histidine kinase